MKKFTKKVVYGFLIGFGLLTPNTILAQLGISNFPSSQCFNGINQATCVITASIVGTTSYSWSYASYPCGSAPIITSTTSSAPLNLPCVGNYSICCVALNSSNTPTGFNCTNVYVAAVPTITVTGASSVCLGNNTTLNASGAMTYTWSIGSPLASINVNPIANTCYTVAGTNSIGCTGSAVHCLTVQTTNILISPSYVNVCKGSSTSFTASGANSYTWYTSPASYNSSVNVIPLVLSVYTVTGVGSNGCIGTSTVAAMADTTCSHVWPGDANRDGVVNNTDVFEIGLAFNNTGTARSPGGNSYTSQFANNWVGTVSTGWNKAHADCNGDGTVNNSDTVAIHTNYLLTHSFKNAESVANGDISFSSNSSNINEGMWNKVDIMFGSTSSPMSSVYGVAFDVNFDNSLIETNAAYIVYTSSFLNASNTNVQFRKGDFTNGKIYAASVRVNGTNVSGSGKIGEFWFKAKTGLPANSVLNISASNASKISNSKVTAMLTGGTATLMVVKNAVGISENNLEHNLQLYPNPASNLLTLQNSENVLVAYTIYDIVGRVVVNGEFSQLQTIDLSAFANGTYIVHFESEGISTYKKFVVEK